MDEDQEGKFEINHTMASFRVEHPAPPPPGFTSPFKTLQEWLFHFCDSDHLHPEKSISEYMFVISDPPGEVDIYLVGYTYTVEQGVPARRIGFQPAHWYFPLPKKEYSHLTKQQLQEKILYELKEFTKIALFQHSFLSKGYSITTNFTDEIWTR